MKNIGLLLGSFNPIHKGHFMSAKYFLKNTDLNEIWFVVTPKNPLKDKETMSNKFDRLNMVKLVVENQKNMFASDFEFNLPIPNFTYNTLKKLNLKYPKNKFILIIGEDNFNSIEKWKNYQEIIKNNILYVYPRENSLIKKKNLKNCFFFDNAPKYNINSTFIRKKINSSDISNLLNKKVLEYIKVKKLYI